MRYDSDSASDTESLTELPVLLGYAEKEPTDDAVSQLGGRPTWLHPESPADSRLAKCQNCNRLMPMLLQLNGAIPESPHERRFYVFACKEKTCRRKKGTARALRGVQCLSPKPAEKNVVQEEKKETPVETTTAEERPKVDMGDFLFGTAQTTAKSTPMNPFSLSSTPSKIENPFSTTATSNPFSSAPKPAPPAPIKEPTLSKTFAETLKISNSPTASSSKKEESQDPLFYGPPEPWPEPLPNLYPSYYLDADYETLESKKPVISQKIQTVADESDEMPMSGAAFESSLDKTFQKFADRVEQNPEQVLRYERLGHPLLYSKDDETAKTLLDSHGQFTTKRIPPCKNCGKPGRVFEFQLMPHAITMLESDDMGLDGMEWGTMIVATCICVPRVVDRNGVGYVEEWVGVQWESQK